MIFTNAYVTMNSLIFLGGNFSRNFGKIYVYIDKASYLKSLLTSAAEVFHFVLLYSTLLEKLSLSMLPDFPEINYKTPKTLFRNLGISAENRKDRITAVLEFRKSGSAGPDVRDKSAQAAGVPCRSRKLRTFLIKFSGIKKDSSELPAATRTCTDRALTQTRSPVFITKL